MRRKSKKAEITAAAVRLVAERGSVATTIRAIASEAGVTDAAVYRHFHSKQELCWSAYAGIMEEMVREKVSLATGSAPIEERLREWVRLSYSYFDNNRAAFTFVFITPQVHEFKDHCLNMEQGELFMDMISRAQAAGEIRAMDPRLALSHFAGLLLNVPRLINEGSLAGPASSYVEEVASVAWRIFRKRSG